MSDKPLADEPETSPGDEESSKKISRLKYAQMKQIDEAIAPMIRKLSDGYCEYIDPDMDDHKAAAAISEKIGFELTAANVSYIRRSEYGRLKATPPPGGAASTRASALTERMDKLEADLAAILAIQTTPEGQTVDLPEGFMARMSKLETVVATLRSRDASREQVFTETVARINKLEERFEELLSATIAESSGVESRLATKYRIATARPRKR